MEVLHSLPKPFFVLAPMDDVTDTVFRQIIAECAAPNLFFTEFVNVDGLQSPGRDKLLGKLQFSASERSIIAQLWGKNPENYYKTAQEIVVMGFSGVDINMGCPDKAVMKNGCCAALIDNRQLAGEIITAVREAVGPHFPVSVKTRVGITTFDLSWTQFLLEQKLNMLTVHGRTVKELSKVPAHWDIIGEVCKQRSSLSPATLVVGNGDVINRDHGLELAEQYKVDGLMIGRGIFNDPFAFAAKSIWSEFSKSQRVDLYRKHVLLFAKLYGNSEKTHSLNKFCKIYINGFDGAKELRERLMKASTPDELLDMLNKQ